MKKRYDIQLVIWGFEYTLKDKYYSDVMRSHIAGKFGQNFLESVEAEAKKEYEKI